GTFGGGPLPRPRRAPGSLHPGRGIEPVPLWLRGRPAPTVRVHAAGTPALPGPALRADSGPDRSAGDGAAAGGRRTAADRAGGRAERHGSGASDRRSRPPAGTPATGSREWRAHGSAAPARLKQIYDPPARLFVNGQLPSEPMIAIVGSRHATPYGRRTAQRLARDLSDAGVVVVGGLARGIDAAAHRGALEGRSPTVAVM